MEIDKINPISKLSAYTPPPLEAQAIHRYSDIAQMLFDALVPFIVAYEKGLPNDDAKPDEEIKNLEVLLKDIRRAQAVLRGLATDIYV